MLFDVTPPTTGMGSVRVWYTSAVADGRLLVPGETCWRVAHADQFARIVDAADYFRHTKAAMLRAQQRIVIVGWDLDVRTTFERGSDKLPGPNQLGAFLYWMLWKRPELEIYLLRSNLRLLPAFDGIWFGLTPVTVVNQFTSRRMHFAVDGAHPIGAVHHQKIVVVDDAVAFCGGIDLTLDRWDTTAHEDGSRGRRSIGRAYGPRHDVGMAVDGEAARALAELARDRWHAATGQSLDAVEADHATWPAKLEPTLRAVDVGIARTFPELGDRREIREIEALDLAAIAAARHTIYLENQYLAAQTIVDALADRLREEDGPEVVIVLPRRGNNRLERETMDSARHRLIQVLWEADEHGRLGVYYPVTEGGTPIYVHSKVLVIDDRMMRIGSSNLNNRSLGFDSECDVAIEIDPDGPDDTVCREIVSLRNDLVAEHLGVPVGALTLELGESLLAAIDTLRGEGKTLQLFTEKTIAGEAGPLSENDLVDPDHVPKSVYRSVQRFIAGLAQSDRQAQRPSHSRE